MDDSTKAHQYSRSHSSSSTLTGWEDQLACEGTKVDSHLLIDASHADAWEEPASGQLNLSPSNHLAIPRKEDLQRVILKLCTVYTGL